jgi:hypothetical protein
VSDPRPLITARHKHKSCRKVVAKYWRHGDEGRWFGRGLGALGRQFREGSAPLDELAQTTPIWSPELQEWEGQISVFTWCLAVLPLPWTLLCSCEPPPALPDGAELAALVARAEAEAKAKAVDDHWHTPLTIYVR